MARWMESAAGGTSHRLKPAGATETSRSRNDSIRAHLQQRGSTNNLINLANQPGNQPGTEPGSFTPQSVIDGKTSCSITYDVASDNCASKSLPSDRISH